MTKQWVPFIGKFKAPGGMKIEADSLGISMGYGSKLLAIAEWPDENIRLCQQVEVEPAATAMTEQLKPCPHCGEEANLHLGNCVICSDCSAMIGYHDTEEKAIAVWNTRQPDPQVAELEARIQKLERLLNENVAEYDRIKGGVHTAIVCMINLVSLIEEKNARISELQDKMENLKESCRIMSEIRDSERSNYEVRISALEEQLRRYEGEL